MNGNENKRILGLESIYRLPIVRNKRYQNSTCLLSYQPKVGSNRSICHGIDDDAHKVRKYRNNKKRTSEEAHNKTLGVQNEAQNNRTGKSNL